MGSGLVLMDLKTRKEGARVYTSDEVQVGAYEMAWTRMNRRTVDRRTVLVAREDGTWDEVEATTPPAVFIHLLAVYSILKGRS